MVKLFLVICALVGFSIMASMFFPSSHNHAFTMVGHSFTWLFVGCVGLVWVAWKAIK